MLQSPSEAMAEEGWGGGLWMIEPDVGWLGTVAVLWGRLENACAGCTRWARLMPAAESAAGGTGTDVADTGTDAADTGTDAADWAGDAAATIRRCACDDPTLCTLAFVATTSLSLVT
jgi:hypothetical protein